MPENVNYGDPNAYPTNFFAEAAMEQQQTEQNISQMNQVKSQQSQQNKSNTSINKDKIFNKDLTQVKSPMVPGKNDLQFEEIKIIDS